MSVVVVPIDRLSQNALRGLIEEFVSREGTDYGEEFFSFEEKSNSIMQQLTAGDVLIVFDTELQSSNLIAKIDFLASEK